MKQPNNESGNILNAVTFVPLNEWNKKNFFRALHVLRDFNRDQCTFQGFDYVAREIVDFDWKMPHFDSQTNVWVDVDREDRGVSVILTWIVT